jgi:hypothetical protein
VKKKTIEQDVADRFAEDVAAHALTVDRDDDLYRHLRFRRPSAGTYWFDLITWPGMLVIDGDMGTYAFARLPDMFEFFRAPRGWSHDTINPHYWAEKITAGKDNVSQYSEAKFRARLNEELAEYEQRYPALEAEYAAKSVAYWATPTREQYPSAKNGPRLPQRPESPASIRDEIQDADADGHTTHEAGARQLLHQFDTSTFLSGTLEWDLTDWTHRYLWCCHAIQWGIALYDEPKATVAGGGAR